MTYAVYFGTNIIEMALLLRIFPNPAKVSSSGGIFAGAGFLRDLEKMPDSGFTALVLHSFDYYCLVL